MRKQKAFPGVLFDLAAPECSNQRRNSTASATLASKPLEFSERTLHAYDKNNVLPADVNTCDIERCENNSQALQVIPLPKSANWIDINLQHRTTPDSDYMSPNICVEQIFDSTDLAGLCHQLLCIRYCCE